MVATPNLNITLPTPGTTTSWGSALNPASGSTSGSGLNYVFNQFDAVFADNGSGTSVGLQVGSGKTLLVGGTFRAASGSTVLMGADGASGTVAGNTIRAGNASGSDTSGGNLTLQGGNSTGNAAGGSIYFQVAAAGASSGSSANTLRNVLRVESTNRVGVNTGSTAPAVTLDVGAGGSSGSATAQQSIRLNGSSAGDGTQGGALMTIANNGTNTGALGNYSAVMGASTAYAADTTLASSSTLRFFTGATIAGATASNERLRLGTAGEIGVWDATLVTPAINYGTSGQVLRSNGTGSAVAWGDTTKVIVNPGTSVGTSNSYTINNTSITAAYKVLELFLFQVSHNDGGNNRYITIEISGDNGSNWTTASQITINDDAGQQFTGTIKIVNAAVSSGTRYIIGATGLLNNNGGVFNAGYSFNVTTGYINAIRLKVSDATKVFDGGSVSLVGYN